VLPKPALRPHSTRGYAFDRPWSPRSARIVAFTSRYLTYEDATEYVSWLHHEAEVVRGPAESVVRGAVQADPDDEYLVGLAGTLGGGDSYLLSVDRHLLDLPDRAVKDGEGRNLARILTPGEFLREIEQESHSR
jgi:predicted nucleic acid-binding protein